MSKRTSQPGLQALRPKAGADPLVLKALLEEGDWQATLPSALPEDVLLALARDLRSIERFRIEESDDEPDLAAPLFIVLELLGQHPTRGDQAGKQLKFSHAAMMEAFEAYQWAVEREIVTRLVGLGTSHDTERLLVALEAVIDR